MDVVAAGDLLLGCIGDAQIVSLLDSPILANTVLNVGHLATTRVTAQVFNNREMGTGGGQSVTGANNKKSPLCTGCRKLLKETVVLQCKGCKVAKYCDQKCQKGHWSEYKVLCSAVQQLSHPNSAKFIYDKFEFETLQDTFDF